MATYVPDATNVSQPDTNTVKASTAAAEFRTLKTYIRDVILAGIILKAPIASPTFTGTATLEDLLVTGNAQAPTALAGTADDTIATTAFVATAALTTVIPGAVGNDGLSLTSNGTDTLYRYSTPDAIAILGMIGAF